MVPPVLRRACRRPSQLIELGPALQMVLEESMWDIRFLRRSRLWGPYEGRTEGRRRWQSGEVGYEVHTSCLADVWVLLKECAPRGGSCRRDVGTGPCRWVLSLRVGLGEARHRDMKALEEALGAFVAPMGLCVAAAVTCHALRHALGVTTGRSQDPSGRGKPDELLFLLSRRSYRRCRRCSRGWWGSRGQKYRRRG